MNEQQKSDSPGTIMRRPAEESVDLYPGLCVDDERVSGSITASRSRLPLWAFVGIAIEEGWEAVCGEDGGWPYMEEEYSWTKKRMSDFLYYLMEARGEFGRLLLLIAEAERLGPGGNEPRWYEQEDLRQCMKEQLQRCLDVLQD